MKEATSNDWLYFAQIWSIMSKSRCRFTQCHLNYLFQQKLFCLNWTSNENGVPRLGLDNNLQLRLILDRALNQYFHTIRAKLVLFLFIFVILTLLWRLFCNNYSNLKKALRLDVSSDEFCQPTSAYFCLKYFYEIASRSPFCRSEYFCPKLHFCIKSLKIKLPNALQSFSKKVLKWAFSIKIQLGGMIGLLRVFV